MLIRSQDKVTLVNLEQVKRLTAGKIYGNNETDWIIEVDRQAFNENLGKYSSKDKAIKVVDMISECFIKNQNINSVFIMPQDSEVE